MFKRALLGVAAALLLVGLAGKAEAVVVIDVDPGPVGGQSNSPLVSEEFFPGGQTSSFHYVFEDMKHIEALIWGWSLPDDFDPSGPLDLSYVFYLTDMFGNEIDGTRDEGSGDIGGALDDSQTIPIVAHDFFIEITPNQNILVNIFVGGLVGEWVPDELPEPAAITLFGFGLAGLGLALHGAGQRRRRRA